MKTAILQVADTSPLESLVVMLRSVGYKCLTPSEELKRELRAIGCDTVLDIAGLVAGWGYEQPMYLPEASIKDMDRCDLYVDVKGHRAYPKVVGRWPRLAGKVLWFRINGGAKEHVIRRHDDGTIKEDCGDEVNPPCPVLTPNQWYKGDSFAFAHWPPFYRFPEYEKTDRSFTLSRRGGRFTPPLCLIHNVEGWGYSALIKSVREMGIKCHGAGSPDGLIDHKEVMVRLGSSLCMVHLKSNDAPGYAIYEALATGCPLVCSHRLIWRCRMQDLLIDGQTCLTFDQAEHHAALLTEDVDECKREISEHLKRLMDAGENRKLGLAGRERLKEVMWDAGKKEDVESLRTFMERNFK